jgi:hypothetical protein
VCSSGSVLPEFLREPDENSFGTSNIAEPIRFSVLDHLANEFRPVPAEPEECVVDVLHSEHDA